MDDLDQLLAGRDRTERVDACRPFLDTFEELARQLKVDVGLEQDPTNFTQPFLDVGFGQNTAATQAGERGFELFAQVFEHSL